MFNRWRLAKVVSVAALAVVLTGGAASASTLRASDGHSTGSRHHGRDHRGSEGVFGTVASVNGTTTTGACGITATTGVFTLNGEDNTTLTVDVSTTTTFNEQGVVSPSFAAVCVGGRAGALGRSSGSTVTTTAVFVVPPPTPKPHTVFGTVASVNGTTTTGACGIPATTGVFTLNGEDNTTFTVDVSTTTTFNEQGVVSPSFADVCVGGRAGALGLISSGTVTATAVFVTPPPAPQPHGVFGTVASVNGTTTTGACGMTTTTGDFTLNAEHNKTFTVDVSTTTKFAGHGLSTPSFADVCVGGRVGAFGLISSGTVTATAVFVTPAVTSPPHHASFVPSQVSSPEGSSKVSQPTDHFQGRQGGSGSGAGHGSNSSGNTSGHHHG